MSDIHDWLDDLRELIDRRFPGDRRRATLEIYGQQGGKDILLETWDIKTREVIKHEQHKQKAK